MDLIIWPISEAGKPLSNFSRERIELPAIQWTPWDVPRCAQSSESGENGLTNILLREWSMTKNRTVPLLSPRCSFSGLAKSTTCYSTWPNLRKRSSLNRLPVRSWPRPMRQVSTTANRNSREKPNCSLMTLSSRRLAYSLLSRCALEMDKARSERWSTWWSNVTMKMTAFKWTISE